MSKLLTEVEVCLCGLTRKDGDRSSEAVVVLGRCERVGRALHCTSVLDDDAAVVGRVTHEAQVCANVAHTRR